MLYIDKQLSSLCLDEALSRLPSERREKMLAIGNDSVRRQSIGAYLLLCRALREEYGIAEPPALGYEDGGKPFLADHPTIHFNLSHCRTAVACAVSRRPIGVDIESRRPVSDALARHVLNAEEYHAVATAEDREIAFLTLWTRKEALLKLTGEGIRGNLKDVLERDDAVINTIVDGDIVCSVAEWADNGIRQSDE